MGKAVIGRGRFNGRSWHESAEQSAASDGQLAKESMMFTDYYAESSCTAGRANFITGMLPIRTGITTVHGFDEFSGYLYHLDARPDPY
jgi:hypothetical protein